MISQVWALKLVQFFLGKISWDLFMLSNESSAKPVYSLETILLVLEYWLYVQDGILRRQRDRNLFLAHIQHCRVGGQEREVDLLGKQN